MIQTEPTLFNLLLFGPDESKENNVDLFLFLFLLLLPPHRSLSLSTLLKVLKKPRGSFPTYLSHLRIPKRKPNFILDTNREPKTPPKIKFFKPIHQSQSLISYNYRIH